MTIRCPAPLRSEPRSACEVDHPQSDIRFDGLAVATHWSYPKAHECAGQRGDIFPETGGNCDALVMPLSTPGVGITGVRNFIKFGASEETHVTYSAVTLKSYQRSAKSIFSRSINIIIGDFNQLNLYDSAKIKAVQ